MTTYWPFRILATFIVRCLAVNHSLDAAIAAKIASG
jgi:hypothetical protein